MDFSLLLLAGAVFLALSPGLAWTAVKIWRAAQAPENSADARIIAKLRQLEQEKRDRLLDWEEQQVQAIQMVDRVRMLERLLIEERRQRLIETEEILALRERCKTLEERLAKAANAIRHTTSIMARRETAKQY